MSSSEMSTVCLASLTLPFIKGATFNCHGLKGKESAVNDFIGSHQLDFMILVETWHDGDRAPSIGNVFASISFKANERHHRGIVFILNPSLRGRASIRYRNSTKQILIVDLDEVSIVATYWEPGLSEAEVQNRLHVITQHTAHRPFIICGDLNAKIEHSSFDNSWNTAGRAVWAWAEETELEIIQPTKGRYTFFQYRNGQLIRSALDYVISAQVPVVRMTVHEDDSIGGSDHRPITFGIPQKPKGRKFFRWNVRKLNDPEIRTRYTEISKKLAPILRSDLNSTDNVNVAWDMIKRWIRRSAQQSCGRFCYNGFRFSAADTEDIRLAKTRLKEITTKMAQGDELAHLDLQSATATFTELVQEQERLNRQTLANELSSQQNAASLLKIISNRKNQRSRSHCRLRVTEMQAHVQHFRSTFGIPHPISSFRDEENTGIDPTSVETVGDVSISGVSSVGIVYPGVTLNATGPGIERSSTDTSGNPNLHQYDPIHISRDMIQSIIMGLRLGSACGVDGLPAEFLRYAPDSADILAILLNMITEQCKIPDEWRIASIVPVYKGKGDRLLAASHRPIALTVLCRRIYEKCILPELEDHISKLSNWQGGFRSKRSALMQVFALHETIVQESTPPHCIALDIKTAYDKVNRAYLWERMEHQLGISPSTIKRLQDLFDHNSSILLISGQSSEKIRNESGLLQGSSLSPILFNFFIDPLIQELNLPSTREWRKALAFADDVMLTAKNKDDLQDMLQICEAWADSVGLQFAAEKCFYLRVEQHPNHQSSNTFHIHNGQIASADTVTYLGIPFSSKGIDLEKNINLRTKTSAQLIATMGSLGMHGTGFATQASVRLYKAFIRPTLEYGLQLEMLDEKLINRLERVQCTALRTIFSAPVNTSIDALHRLTCLESMRLRNTILQYQFFQRLNSSEEMTPAQIYWLRNRNSTITASLALRFNKENAIYTMNNNFTQLSQREKREFTVCELEARSRGMTNVGSSVTFDTNLKLRACFQADVLTNRNSRILINRWLCGNVANHQTCKKCQGTASRIHVIQCTGIETSIMNIDPEFKLCHSWCYNALDQAFQFLSIQIVQVMMRTVLKRYTLNA